MPKGRYPRTCKICVHPERFRMELALASGRGLMSVRAEFFTGGTPNEGRDALRRHWKSCVSAKRKAELLAGPIEIDRLANRAAEENRSLLEYAGILKISVVQNVSGAAGGGAGL